MEPVKSKSDEKTQIDFRQNPCWSGLCSWKFLLLLMIGVIVKVVRVVNNVAPEGSVAIGRGTVWGNPFIVGADGEREVVVAKFYHYAKWRLEREPDWLEPLRGKDLACYCSPNKCHGDAIIALLSQPVSKVCKECDNAECPGVCYDTQYEVEVLA